MGKTKENGASMAAPFPVSSRHAKGGLPAVEAVDAYGSSFMGQLATATWEQGQLAYAKLLQSAA